MRGSLGTRAAHAGAKTLYPDVGNPHETIHVVPNHLWSGHHQLFVWWICHGVHVEVVRAHVVSDVAKHRLHARRRIEHSHFVSIVVVGNEDQRTQDDAKRRRCKTKVGAVVLRIHFGLRACIGSFALLAPVHPLMKCTPVTRVIVRSCGEGRHSSQVGLISLLRPVQHGSRNADVAEWHCTRFVSGTTWVRFPSSAP